MSCYRHLSAEEREVILKMILEGFLQATIAERLGRPGSTISRELSRHRLRGKYSALTAQRRAEFWQSRKGRKKKLSSKALCREVENRLSRGHSPEQISLGLKKDFPGDKALSVSHETIYQHVYEDRIKQGGKLYLHLRRKRRYRRRRLLRKDRRGRILGRVTIEQRPASVEDRLEAGHWEGDLVEGRKGSGYLVTLTERKTRSLRSSYIPSKKPREVNKAVRRMLRRLPPTLRRTLTFDNGMEFSGFEDLEKSLGLSVYFCHPYSAFERGTNENTNGLLREWIPKSSDLRKLERKKLAEYVGLLNTRPRKCLGIRTPDEALRAELPKTPPLH